LRTLLRLRMTSWNSSLDISVSQYCYVPVAGRIFHDVGSVSEINSLRLQNWTATLRHVQSYDSIMLIARIS